jgi:hypothetical protein
MLKRLIVGLIVIASVSSFTACNSNKKAVETSNQPANTQTNTQANKPNESTSKKDDSIKAGQYKVGVDIQPGEYLVVGDSGGGYVEVAKDSKGSIESIVMNDNIQGRVYVTIEAGQYITIKDAKTYTVDKAPKVAAKDNKLPSGQYKVGVDIQPGEYKVASTSESYIEVSKSSRHKIEDIVTNDNFTGEKYITIADGQYITIKDGELLLK